MLLGRKYLKGRWDVVDGLRWFSRVSKRADERGVKFVLVHGLGVSSRYMTPLACELARAGWDTFVPDLPGFGRSAKPEGVFSVEELAASLREWLKTVGIEQALLVGNSMGCQVITELAHIEANQILACAFLGPTMDQFAWSPASHVAGLLWD